MKPLASGSHRSLIGSGVLVTLTAAPRAARACPDCALGELARASVFDDRFGWNLLIVCAPLFVVGALAMLAQRVDAAPLAPGRSSASGAARGGEPTRRGPLVAAGTVLGAGLGGFVDGIVLHQILQWHNLLSNRVPPIDLLSMKHNMVWDGLFHALTWCMTCAGLVLLFRAGRRRDVRWTARTFAGSLSLGWGAFNVIEGAIDHHLLELHHVRPGPRELAWDVGFLIFGGLLIVIGGALIRADRQPRRT